MEGLKQALEGHASVALQSSVLLYYFEAHPEHGPLSRAMMREISDGLPAVASVLTVLDSLVMPYRLRQADQVARHRAMLQTFPHLRLLPIDLAAAELAAQLRARSPRLTSPDALAIAVGLNAGATLYVTNGSRALQLPEIKVLNLRDLAVDG